MLARLGRLIAHHPRTVLLAWLAAVVTMFALAVGGVAGQGLFERLGSGQPRVAGDAQTGRDLLAEASSTGSSVLAVVDDVDPAADVTRDAVGAAAADVAAVPGVVAVVHPFLPEGSPVDPRAFVAADGGAVLVSVSFEKGLAGVAEQEAQEEVVQRLEALAEEVPGASARAGSVEILTEQITEQVEVDLRTGEVIALPISLLVMVVVFGGFLAAGMPVLGAIASIAGALGSLLGFSYVIDLDSSVVSVVTVLGLGLSIDYGLLLTSRYREELRRLHAAAGAGPEDAAAGTATDAATDVATDAGTAAVAVAVADRPSSPEALVTAMERTLETAGRTVVFSAVTVAISLSGLMLFSADILRAIGAAGMSVVVVALLVAVTLVPALLAVAGDRMIRPGFLRRVPGLRRFSARFGDVAPEVGAFSRLAERVQRRPVVVLLAVLGVLVLLALPVLRMQLVSSGVELLPRGNAQRELFLDVAERFPVASAPPVQVVTSGGADRLEALAPQIAGLDGVSSVDPVQVQGEGDGTVASIGVRTGADPDSAESRQVVEDIRALGAAEGTYVTGQTAALVDYLDDIGARAPLAIGLVVLATFVLLFLMTGSLLIPVKALLMNVVSLGASLGVLVWVFQDGNLSGVLDFTSNGGIDTTIPPLVLAFGFGLAMDYEVFLLSRIKELRDQGLSNDAAVVAGLQRSGRIITSAALIIVIVFSGFVAGELLIIKQTGVALAVAVAIDATLVRMLLVPATMTLLGEWNWWAPPALRRLHDRFGVSESAVPAGPAPAEGEQPAFVPRPVPVRRPQPTQLTQPEAVPTATPEPMPEPPPLPEPVPAPQATRPAGTLTPDAFGSRLRAGAPAAAELVEDHLARAAGAVLPHRLAADLLGRAEELARSGQADGLRELLAVVSRGVADGDDVLRTALVESFVVPGGLGRPDTDPFLAAWPAALRAELDPHRAAKGSG